MNLWTRFVRWISRKEILVAYEAGLSKSRESTVQLMQQSFLRGHAEGVSSAFEAVEREADTRFAETGDGDFIYPSDVKRAKARSIH